MAGIWHDYAQNGERLGVSLNSAEPAGIVVNETSGPAMGLMAAVRRGCEQISRGLGLA